ncbi:STAS domain-containing protein [Ectothiorhodospiraceae bacterium BW-2]|nr:STAS domain-containing protein [Ectothiorhodospiraceae bacterium BW-2]
MSSNEMDDIGFDPLAWMNQPESSPPPPPPAAAPVTTSATTVGELILDPRLDVASAALLKTQLTEQLAGANSITLNGAAVERVDGAALQLLLAFWLKAERLNIEVSWKEPSSALIHAAEQIGLSSRLAL